MSLAPPTREKVFLAADTHGIHLMPENKLIADSNQLGWRDVYASIAHEGTWEGSVRPIDHYCLAYCVNRSAAVTRRADGRLDRTILRARQFGMIPDQIKSDWTLDGNVEIALLYLRRSFVQKAAEAIFDTDQVAILACLGEQDPLLEQLTLAILNSVRLGDATEHAYIETLASAVAVTMLSRFGDGLRSPARLADTSLALSPGLRRARDYINAELQGDLSLERIAQEAGMSAFYLPKAFRRAFGLPPHRYIVMCRIDRAKTLLVGSDMPIVDVALSTGFSSQSHFTTVFKSMTGKTPAFFRRGI